MEDRKKFWDEWDRKHTRYFQISPVNRSGFMKGIRMGLTNRSDYSTQGLELGLINHTHTEMAGVQVGVLSNDVGGLKGVQVSGAHNDGDVDGLQIALFNDTGEWGEIKGTQVGLANLAGNVKGMQLGGLLNVAEIELNGVQIAPICYAKDGNYVQIGGLLIRGGKNRKWYDRIRLGISWNRKKRK